MFYHSNFHKNSFVSHYIWPLLVFLPPIVSQFLPPLTTVAAKGSNNGLQGDLTMLVTDIIWLPIVYQAIIPG